MGKTRKHHHFLISHVSLFKTPTFYSMANQSLDSTDFFKRYLTVTSDHTALALGSYFIRRHSFVLVKLHTLLIHI